MRSAGLIPHADCFEAVNFIGKFADFHFSTVRALRSCYLVCANKLSPPQSTKQGEIWFIY